MLNALRVDPGRPWLSPASGQETVWRWFGDAMLDCCKRHMLRSLSLNHATEAEEALFATNTDTLDCEARAVLTLHATIVGERGRRRVATAGSPRLSSQPASDLAHLPPHHGTYAACAGGYSEHLPEEAAQLRACAAARSFRSRLTKTVAFKY